MPNSNFLDSTNQSSQSASVNYSLTVGICADSSFYLAWSRNLGRFQPWLQMISPV